MSGGPFEGCQVEVLDIKDVSYRVQFIEVPQELAKSGVQPGDVRFIRRSMVTKEMPSKPLLNASGMS